MKQELPHEYIIIDEQGLPRTADAHFSPEISAEILRQLRFADNGAMLTEVSGQLALVEAFDEPFIGKAVAPPTKNIFWSLELPFQVRMKFLLSSLSCDEWDRFHGLTTEGIPFVLSDTAQNQLFDAVDEFSDDGLKYSGQEYAVPQWLSPNAEVQSESFWSNIYQTEKPGWDLGEPSPVLKDLLPRLKIPKSRVLVLGSGPGHDAAYFAEQGHVVTAVDISPEALKTSKANYPVLRNITWVEADIFKLPREWLGQFDVIFEHTCYCAINPALRSQLVKSWLQLLAPQGHLLGVFFAMEKRQGPPFGGSEWEIRQRLKERFHFLFWGRWRQSIARRNGLELAVYAQKKSE